MSPSHIHVSESRAPAVFTAPVFLRPSEPRRPVCEKTPQSVSGLQELIEGNMQMLSAEGVQPADTCVHRLV